MDGDTDTRVRRFPEGTGLCGGVDDRELLVPRRWTERGDLTLERFPTLFVHNLFTDLCIGIPEWTLFSKSGRKVGEWERLGFSVLLNGFRRLVRLSFPSSPSVLSVKNS